MECWQLTVAICHDNTSLLSYIPSLFRHAILLSHGSDHATIFSRCCHVFKKKPKAIELPFCAKESGKKTKKELGWQIAASDKGSYYTQHESKEVVPGNCVAVILWLYYQCWSCRPESNLYYFLSSLLSFLPSCSHLAKHYCLGEFLFHWNQW